MAHKPSRLQNISLILLSLLLVVLFIQRNAVETLWKLDSINRNVAFEGGFDSPIGAGDTGSKVSDAKTSETFGEKLSDTKMSEAKTSEKVSDVGKSADLWKEGDVGYTEGIYYAQGYYQGVYYTEGFYYTQGAYQGSYYTQGPYYIQGAYLPPPVIIRFDATPASILRHSSTTITWQTSNATLCVGSGVSGDFAQWLVINPKLPVVAGSQVISPGITTVYRLDCLGPGGSAFANVTVTVGGVRWREIIPRLFLRPLELLGLRW